MIPGKITQTRQNPGNVGIVEKRHLIQPAPVTILTQKDVDAGTTKTHVGDGPDHQDIPVLREPGGTDHTPDLVNLETPDPSATGDDINHVTGDHFQGLKNILTGILEGIPDH